MAIVLRLTKGNILTYEELDGNFVELEARAANSYTADIGNNLQWVDGQYDFGRNIIKYSNAIQTESELENYSPVTYHGMTMHVHATGALYYAHAGKWRKLLTDTSYDDVASTGYVDPLAVVAYEGNLGSLTDVVTTNVSDGDILQYNASAGWFEPASITQAEGGVANTAVQPGDNVSTLTNDSGFISSVTENDVTQHEAALTITESQISDLQSYLTSVALDNLTDVSTEGASEGQVLKYNGTSWEPATDLTADLGSGITLEDLSVSVLSAGSANLTYNNATGVFSYTPPDLSGFTSLTAFSVSTTVAGDAALTYDSGTGIFTYTPPDLSEYALSNTVPTTLFDLGIADGTSGQYLQTDGAGTLTWATISTNGIENVVDDTSPQLGSDLDVNGNSVLYTFNVGNSGSSDYTFADPGNHWFPSTENDPVLYLRRGDTYVFNVNASGHPFQIRVSQGGVAYNVGVTNNGTQVGQVIFKVPMSAPSTLYYQCTVHSPMGNTINVV